MCICDYFIQDYCQRDLTCPSRYYQLEDDQDLFPSDITLCSPCHEVCATCSGAGVERCELCMFVRAANGSCAYRCDNGTGTWTRTCMYMYMYMCRYTCMYVIDIAYLRVLHGIFGTVLANIKFESVVSSQCQSIPCLHEEESYICIVAGK